MTAVSHLHSESIKANGVHYTPLALAAFLAEVTVRNAKWDNGEIAVLDPACGDGGLLLAIAQAVSPSVRRRMKLVGYETDVTAAANASERLRDIDVATVDIRIADFLEVVGAQYPITGHSLFTQSESQSERFDVVISNPPYVRTQVLGAFKAQQLAEQFGLTGRVDLYHAFAKAIALVLRPGAFLGLLTSNRFMLVQSGATTRALLRTEFQLRDIYDLGDTKLFSAAVLPAIVVAQRSSAPIEDKCAFTRVYQIRDAGFSDDLPRMEGDSVLEALRQRCAGTILTSEGHFRIDHGELDEQRDLSAPWSLSSTHTRGWLAAIHKKSFATFGEIAQIRVGVKTTADTVFIRDDWDSLPEHIRPEKQLLHPLITHHIAERWCSAGADARKILYPHEESPSGKKQAVDLSKYPRARAYLEQHRERLESRKYVIDAGREWFEIWVPQQPGDWQTPNVVYPDISEEPRFFLNNTGAIVNGDCYWITLKDGVPEDYLLLILAVANSRLGTQYYDNVFHNKLYAGRRRFMTQYVKQYPLPSLDSTESQEIVSIVRKLTAAKVDLLSSNNVARMHEIDRLVSAAFGLPQG